MAFSSQPADSLRPRLGLFCPDDPDLPDTPGGVAISPRMSLSQFFASWFLPIVLAAERDVRGSTVSLYRDSLKHWAEITGDPPLNKIDEFTTALFQTKIRTTQFRRGKFGVLKTLSADTQKKHCRNLNAVFNRTGPTHDRSRPTAELLAKTPYLRVPGHAAKRKAPFIWSQCLAMGAAALQMTQPSIPGITPGDWWRGRLALHLYTGLRSGTIRNLTWAQMVPDERGQMWLEIPDSLVTKTQKEIRIIVHPKLLAALHSTRRTDSPAEPLSVQPHCNRWLQELHERLQSLAGIPEAKWLSPHAWRRTHGDQLAQLGLAAVSDLCRSALDHADARTTTGHYVDVLNKFRLKLPDLW